MGRVAITGADGFLGSALAKNLGEDVLCLTRKDADIVSSGDCLTRLLDGVETLYNLAGVFSTDQNADFSANTLGARNVAIAARLVGVRKLVHVSSVAVFDKTPYGQSKLRGESEVLNEFPNAVVVRPTAIFGENHLGSIYELASAIKKRRFVLIGSGENRLAFQYVYDFIEGIKAAPDSGIFVLPSQIALRLLVKTVCEELGYSVPISVPKAVGMLAGIGADVLSPVIHLPISLRRVMALTRDAQYPGSTFNSFSSLGVEEGIRRTIRWYRESGLI